VFRPGTYLNSNGKIVFRKDRINRESPSKIQFGDIFGIPIKNNDDVNYETCQFRLEELAVQEHENQQNCLRNVSEMNKSAAFKKGNKRKFSQESQDNQVGQRDETDNARSKKRKHSSVSAHSKENIHLYYNDRVDGLCAEINFLRKANDQTNIFDCDDGPILERARHEVHQARRQLADWFWQADLPNEISANIQKLVS
jgi:hypothetical protein